MHKPETYDAGIAHQIGRYADAIRVPAGRAMTSEAGAPGPNSG